MAYDIFAKVHGIAVGDSDTIQFEVLSFSVGVTHPTDPVGGFTGGVEPNPFNITRHTDSSSPILFEACAQGRVINSVSLSFLPAVQKGDSSGVGFLHYVFSDVVIIAVRYAGNENGDILPLEELSFAYRKMEVQYGNVIGVFDFRNATRT